MLPNQMAEVIRSLAVMVEEQSKQIALMQQQIDDLKKVRASTRKVVKST